MELVERFGELNATGGTVVRHDDPASRIRPGTVPRHHPALKEIQVPADWYREMHRACVFLIALTL